MDEQGLGWLGQKAPEKARAHRSALQVCAETVHPHGEGQQEAGLDCQPQRPADTTQWKTASEPLWNFPSPDV